MNNTVHKPPFLIGGIADLLRWFELLIFTISAPVLTVATVIAVVDLLTGGRLLATQPGLVFAFGVALAIGIDSQLPAACERVRDAWEAKDWLRLLLWAVIAAWTGAVIYTALRVFSIEQAQHISETDALALIGIAPDLFSSQRDLLAVVLLGLSGFARVKARLVSRAEEREHLQRELEMEPLRQQVDALKARRMVNVAATGRATVEAALGKETQITQAAPVTARLVDVQPEPLPPEPDPTPTRVPEPASEPDDGTDDGEPSAYVPSILSLTKRTTTRKQAAGKLSPDDVQRIKAFALLDAQPDMSKSQLRKLLGCRQTTANSLYTRWHIERRKSMVH